MTMYVSRLSYQRVFRFARPSSSCEFVRHIVMHRYKMVQRIVNEPMNRGYAPQIKFMLPQTKI